MSNNPQLDLLKRDQTNEERLPARQQQAQVEQVQQIRQDLRPLVWGAGGYAGGGPIGALIAWAGAEAYNDAKRHLNKAGWRREPRPPMFSARFNRISGGIVLSLLVGGLLISYLIGG